MEEATHLRAWTEGKSGRHEILLPPWRPYSCNLSPPFGSAHLTIPIPSQSHLRSFLLQFPPPPNPTTLRCDCTKQLQMYGHLVDVPHQVCSSGNLATVAWFFYILFPPFRSQSSWSFVFLEQCIIQGEWGLYKDQEAGGFV